MSQNPIAILGNFLHFTEHPVGKQSEISLSQATGPADPCGELLDYMEGGLMVIEDGHITALDDADRLINRLPADCQLIDHSDQLLLPGFIDTHVHYPQSEVIASHGTQLLDWLNTYTFPAELRYQDHAYAGQQAAFFLDQLLANGTTTALVFGTVHANSVDAFFTEARLRNLRMICGKVMMDRNAPAALCDTPETSYAESKRLIETWHGRDRLGYAVTPRFAPTSSSEQLAGAGQLLAEHPDVHLHTHLSENTRECHWVSELFPEQNDYLAVYEQFGLVGPKSVFAHAIHLSDSEWSRLAKSGASIAHCPCSNLFIGSGLFKLREAVKRGIDVGLATDVGGGDSFSLFRVINEAYKIQQLQGEILSPLEAIYLATLGGARTLGLDHVIGNFDKGKEADLVLINESATPLMAMRSARCNHLDERLFALAMMGDDRAIEQTYILGKPSLKRQ